MRRLRLLLLILIPAFALSGCFAIETEYMVNEDGSGSQTIRLTLPSEPLGMADGETPSVEDLQAEFEADPEMAELRETLEANGGSMDFFATEDGVGFEMTINVPSSDDFAAALDELAATLPEGTLPVDPTEQAELSLKKVGDKWQFVTETQALTEEDMAEMAGDPSMAGMMGSFLDQMTIVTRLKLPGDVTDHNADEVLPDGTLVWNMTGADGGRTLTATSDVSTGLGTPLIAGIAIGALVLIGLVALAVTKKGAFQGPTA